MNEHTKLLQHHVEANTSQLAIGVPAEGVKNTTKSEGEHQLAVHTARTYSLIE
jgi:hypothetical protein